MSISVFAELIIGVPLMNLGKIVEQEKKRNLTDALGRSLNRKATLMLIYFKTLKGECFLIGSNEESIANPNRYNPDEIEYKFHELLGFKDEDEFDESGWLHPEEPRDPEEIIIGLSPEIIIEDSMNRRDKCYLATTVENIQSLIPKVSEFLKEKFGYTDKIYVFSKASAG